MVWTREKESWERKNERISFAQKCFEKIEQNKGFFVMLTTITCVLGVVQEVTNRGYILFIILFPNTKKYYVCMTIDCINHFSKPHYMICSINYSICFLNIFNIYDVFPCNKMDTPTLFFQSLKSFTVMS